MRFPKIYLVAILAALVLTGAAAARCQMPTEAPLVVQPLPLSAPLPKQTPPPTPAAAVPVAATPRKARISGGVMAGLIVTKVAPVYPAEAKAKGISGTVVLHAIIGKNGAVEELTTVAGNAMLAQAAIDAVSQWVYRPYLLNGNPTEVDTTVTVNFNLAPPPPTPQP